MKNPSIEFEKKSVLRQIDSIKSNGVLNFDEYVEALRQLAEIKKREDQSRALVLN